jgi:hypothetical protein
VGTLGRPLPESAEQCAARHSFGAKTSHNVLLRIRRSGKKLSRNDKFEYYHDGILEWPDFGASVRVKCIKNSDGTISIEETQLLFGSKDSGWISRFGQPLFVAGSYKHRRSGYRLRNSCMMKYTVLLNLLLTVSETLLTETSIR